MSMTETIAAYIRQNQLASTGGSVLAAVSGGPDSLCMLLVLRDLGFGIIVAHFDHGLREDSSLDAEVVRRWAEDLRLPFVLGKEDVREFAAQRRMGLEEAARVLRYRFLGREAVARRTGCVAVGHTADDQAETILMHLLRGAGPAGLRGIQPRTSLDAWIPEIPPGSVQIIRPLLAVRHSDTLEYCQQSGFSPLLDPSNAANNFWRNRIRHELMPLLETYNPRAVVVINRLAYLMQVQLDFVEARTDIVWSEICNRRSAEEVRLRCALLIQQPLAIQQALVRKAVLALRPTLRDLAYRHVKQALSFIQLASASGKIDLALGIVLLRDGEDVIFQSRMGKKEPLPWREQEVPVPGSIGLGFLSWAMSTELMTGRIPEAKLRDGNSLHACLDADQIAWPLQVRRRMPGDRFDPLGMRSEVKLSDFMAGQHMPARQRNEWPLVCDSQGILWVPGYRIGDRAKVRDETKRWVSLSVRSLEEMMGGGESE
jgi:tRNA(Ile)-lysidine synthase